MILWLYELRRNEPTGETFKHALVIEEAHHVLSEKKERSEGVETIMETCLRQIREFGEAVIVLDQEPSKLSNSINANTHTKISFSLGANKDMNDTSNELQTQETNLALLGVGEAMVTVRGRIIRPILVRFPHIQIKKGLITDEYLTRSVS